MDRQALIAFFRQLDRAFFIDNENKQYAQMDQALPIGFGQTISQPSLVLEMTLHLETDRSCRVLEIGTGSGYQTALLAEFSGEVYTIERIPQLAEAARIRLAALGYRNIHYRMGDGSEGWAEHGPYDRILVTAAAARIPDELVDQLKPGGRMILPVGPQGVQALTLVTKDTAGVMHVSEIEKVMFVEFKGKYGWSSSVRDPE